MEQITRVVVTLADGTERTYIGQGTIRTTATEVTREDWVVKKQGEEPSLVKTSQPIGYITVALSPEKR